VSALEQHRDDDFLLDTRQQGDACELLQALPDNYVPLGFFDPQSRESLDRLRYGNEGVDRKRERAKLPAMPAHFIDICCPEFARVLRPSNYLMRWMDTFALVEGVHLRIEAKLLKPVDLIATDNLVCGIGYRSRRKGDFLLVQQKPPIKAKATWSDHGIPDRWVEKVDRSQHPHIKPIGLIKRLIGATTKPGDVVVDPCAGSFLALHAATALGRHFIGCDFVLGGKP
jgi:site-specific DNA-methyltransferase (adenine-specific)